MIYYLVYSIFVNYLEGWQSQRLKTICLEIIVQLTGPSVFYVYDGAPPLQPVRDAAQHQGDTDTNQPYTGKHEYIL